MNDPLREAERRIDGRNVDPAVGRLAGEGALQRVRRRAPEAIPETFAGPEGEGPSYHGLPLLKEPVWRWYIPAYFTVGGLAGACGVLGAAAQAFGGPGTAALVRRCRLVATGGAIASAALLVADLGRPARFLDMLRVFRPTSPMNMGSWVLSGFGACAALSALPALAPLAGPAARVADLAGYGAGFLGLPLVGYTGVLLSNTAVPVWQETRRTLPVLFAFSGAVSAGALFQAWSPRGPGSGAARRFGLLAKGAEVVFSIALHREAGRVPRVARALSRGRAGVLLGAARLLTAASLAVDLAAGPGHRRGQRAAGLMALAGTLALRFGIAAAGRQSARDPFATFEQQRAGRGAAELVKKHAAPPPSPALPGAGETGKESAGLGPSP